MEEVCGLIPMDPHAAKVITKQVVKRVPGKERQAVWDPVSLVGRIVEVRLCPLAKIANGLGTLLICPGPDTKSNTVECVRGVLLQDEGVVHTVRLGAPCADFNIMGETCLWVCQSLSC